MSKRRGLLLHVAIAGATLLCTAGVANASAPPTSPSPSQANVQQQNATTGGVQPADESGDVTRLLLLGLVGFIVLVVVPTQVSKGIAERRRTAARGRRWPQRVHRSR